MTWQKPTIGWPHHLWQNLKQDIETCKSQPKGIKYMIGQEESASTTGRIHLQAAVIFKKRRTLNSVRDYFRTFGCGNPHFEVMRGTLQQAANYATKEATRLPGGQHFEEGAPDATRGMSKSAVDACLAGEISVKVLQETYPEDYLRHHAAFEKMLALHLAKRDWQTKSIVLYGPTGTGKTFYAREKWPEAYHLTIHRGATQTWWQGYSGEAVIIIDEFYGQLPFVDLLRYIDSSPMVVQVKHGHYPFQGKLIVFTTNTHPKDWYRGANLAEARMKALWRRLTSPIGKVLRFDIVPDIAATGPTIVDITNEMPDFRATTGMNFSSGAPSTHIPQVFRPLVDMFGQLEEEDQDADDPVMDVQEDLYG